MLISIVNKTKETVSDEELQRVIRAINRQINEDFAPYWHLHATLRLEGRSTDKPDAESSNELRGDAILYLCDDINVPAALGYHDDNNRGIPYGFVSTTLSQKIGDSHWSVTLSHEALELLADSETNLLVRGPHPESPDKEVFHWFEMCDAVQSETYEIDGVAVSNFVLPLYYSSAKVDARFDYLCRNHDDGPLRPFHVNPGGYIGFYDPALKDNKIYRRPNDEKAAQRVAAKADATTTRGARRRAPQVNAIAPRVEVLKPAAEVGGAAPTWQTVKLADLKPGDVLLARGTAWISRAIETLDGHGISHAALYAGDGNVDEATREGVKQRTIVYAAEDDEWIRVRRIGDPLLAADAIAKAKTFIAEGDRYSYEQMVLLAMMTLTRRIPFTPSVGVVVRRILDQAAEILNKMIMALEGQKKEPMICSELVFRCFDEPHPGSIRIAEPERAFAAAAPARLALDSKVGHGIEEGSVLHLLSTKGVTAPQAPRLAIRANAELTLEQLVRQYLRETTLNVGEGELQIDPMLEASIVVFAAADQRARGGGATSLRAATPESAVDSFMTTARDFVTPGDLLTSPSLASLGQIDDHDIHPTDHQSFAAAWKRLSD
jgi:hypothetical protein